MEQFFESVFGPVQLSDDPALLDLKSMHAFLTNSYWSENISCELLEKAIRHSIPFGVYINKKQVGFARVITDQATFAYLADVFILEPYRGKGISKKLMAFIHAHPQLQGLRRWMLVTRDAHALYRQFGWTEISNPERFMQKHQPGIYKKLD